MKYFKPVLQNGQEVQLPIQLVVYKYNFLWPLEERSSRNEFILHYGLALISLMAFFLTILAEFTFFGENIDNIAALSECLTTTCLGVQYFLRISLRLRHQDEIRKIFKRFYQEIYFFDSDDVDFRKEVLKKERIADYVTKYYYVPMVFMYIKYAWDIFQATLHDTTKPYIYRMAFPLYDAQQPFAYIITSLYTSWLAFSCVSLESAEDFSLCSMLCHASYRIKELHKRLDNISNEARAERRHEFVEKNVHSIFRQKLYEIFRKQQQIYSFIMDAKAYFSHHIFYCLGFGVIVICVVSFESQHDAGITMFPYVGYGVWLLSQALQIILIGYFGQMLTDACAELQQSYYMCHWETILPYGDVGANKLLMNDIRFAIMNAQRPVGMDALKVVSLNHSTVGAVFRAALSYVMFLNTMHDASEVKENLQDDSF